MRFQKRTSSVNARTRCAILLAADASKGRSEKTYSEIASASGASEATVITTLKEFLTDGFTKMITPKRNPASDISRLKVTGDVEAKIIATACSAAPKGYVRWTLNLLYNQMMVVLEDISISRSTIGRILMKNDLRPHLNDYWCIPPEEDAEFVANMEDILDVYQKPYDPKYPLWCMDEKPYQILGEAREPLPMRPGDLATVDSEYVRNGTVSIFCFIQPHTGKLLHSVEPTRTAVDWAEKIKYLVDEVEPDAEKIILVMDNLNTHNISSLYKAFPPEEARRIAKKLEVHYTPKHGSWLDIAEIGINIMTRECLNRRIPSIEALKEELKAWNDEYDKDPSPVNWQFQTTDSRIKLKRLYPDIEKYRKDRDERRTAKLEKK
jgi:DNA-binding Lrp family transcriptional regulator